MQHSDTLGLQSFRKLLVLKVTQEDSSNGRRRHWSLADNQKCNAAVLDEESAQVDPLEMSVADASSAGGGPAY